MRVHMLVSFLSTGFSSRATYGVNILFEEEEKLMDYFEETFVRRMRRSRIVDPLFPMEESHERLEQSHVRERVELGLPRTTNLCEGWHTRFNGCLQVSHPTMYRAIAAVKAEIKVVRTQLIQTASGDERVIRKKISGKTSKFWHWLNDLFPQRMLNGSNGSSSLPPTSIPRLCFGMIRS